MRQVILGDFGLDRGWLGRQDKNAFRHVDGFLEVMRHKDDGLPFTLPKFD